MTDPRIHITDNYEDLMFMMNSIIIAQGSTDRRLKKKTGAVIVKDGNIIGSGNRKTVILQKNPYKDITYHAEHMALMECRDKARGATLYTALEPCASRSVSAINAWEPSPPCCQILFEAGITHVVFAMHDTNFGSGGAKYLLDKGVKVSMCKIPEHIIMTLNVIPVADDTITYRKAE